MKNKKILLEQFELENKEQFVCKRPFELVELDSLGNIYFCFPRCNNKSFEVGNLYEATYEQICKSEKAHMFKKDILSSTYTFCDFNYCSAPNKNIHLNKELLPDCWNITYPKEVRLHIDNICDIKCFMCRDKYIVKSEKEQEFITILIPRIISMCKEANIVFLNGNGEAFFSPLAKELILQLTTEYPNLKFDFCTNGIKCTEKKIKEYNLEGRIKNISISLHAAKEKTYNKVIKGGNFSKVIKNLQYIKQQKDSGNISSVCLNFVVCSYNYKEMVEFLNFANKYNFDVFFSICNFNGDTMSTNSYEEIAVFKENHKEHKNLCKILSSELFEQSNCILDNDLNQIRNNIKTKKESIVFKIFNFLKLSRY